MKERCGLVSVGQYRTRGQRQGCLEAREGGREGEREGELRHEMVCSVI